MSPPGPILLRLDEAIRLDPGFALAYSNRGLAYQQNGQLDKANQDFAKAKQLEHKP